MSDVPTSPASGDARRPLDGIRVVSMAEQYPGPFATMLLADLGAEIIMVERPDTGDPGRLFPAYFEALNRGKRSVTLDLREPEARDQLWELLATADVFLEGFRPGVAARLGFAPDEVRERLPDLVVGSISGFGQDGPYRDRAAHDLTYQGIVGALALGGASDGGELPLPVADISSAMFAAFGVVAALLGRERGGSGTHLDVAMTDSLLAWMTHELVPAMNGQPAAVTLDPAYGVFTASDGGQLTLSCAFEDHFWRRIVEAAGLAELADVPRKERVRRRGELRGRLEDAIGRAPLAYWLERFAEVDVPFGPVNSLDEVADDPQVHARGMVVTVPGAPERRYIRQPLRFDGRAFGPRSVAPALGEDDLDGLTSHRMS